MRPAISAPQLPVNKLTVLTIEDSNTIDSELVDALMGDQREFDLETRVTTNGNNKTPRCFTVVH